MKITAAQINNQCAEPVLIHPQYRFLAIFSAKSACSSVVIWFFYTMGLLEEARNYHEWPHQYRFDKFMPSDSQRATRKIPLDELKFLRVVRDPLIRATSSFRHALATNYAQKWIEEKIGINTQIEGLSFQQFIDFLEKENLDWCDSHHRHQKHPIEEIRPADFLINVSEQDLFTELNNFERLMKMPLTDFNQLKWIHELQAARVVPTVDMGPDADLLILTGLQAQRGLWPKNLLTQRARKRLEKLFAEDIRLYTIKSFLKNEYNSTNQ